MWKCAWTFKAALRATFLGKYLSINYKIYFCICSVTVEWFEKFSLIKDKISNFVKLFVIRGNLLHPCSFIRFVIISLVFFIFVEYNFQVSFNLAVILSMIKLT